MGPQDVLAAVLPHNTAQGAVRYCLEGALSVAGPRTPRPRGGAAFAAEAGASSDPEMRLRIAADVWIHLHSDFPSLENLKDGSRRPRPLSAGRFMTRRRSGHGARVAPPRLGASTRRRAALLYCVWSDYVMMAYLVQLTASYGF